MNTVEKTSCYKQWTKTNEDLWRVTVSRGYCPNCLMKLITKEKELICEGCGTVVWDD